MMRASDLDTLADRLGIVSAWRNAWGEECTAQPETIRALIGAMGFDAASPEAVAASLHRLDECDATDPLPPVVMLTKGESLSVALHLPPAAGRMLHWTIQTEAGQTLSGEVAVARLHRPPAARGTEASYVLDCPITLPLGYYRLRIETGTGSASTPIIVAPAEAYIPPDYTAGGRSWGLAVQLYALRSATDWGIGDFSDLAALAKGAGAAGVDAIGLNPLNALFPTAPDRASPYAPSSRRYLNPLYIDVMAVPDAASCPGFADFVERADVKAGLAAARAADLVDYPDVAKAKHAAFSLLWQSFRDTHLMATHPSARAAEFRAFQQAGGRDLENFALFEALQESFGLPWQAWHADYRDPASDAVAGFAVAQRDAIERAQYLQWEADRQLRMAAASAAEAGLGIGFYRDLAVGFDPSGADAWCDRRQLISGATVGAPPDVLNRKGQNWGLAAMAPRALRQNGYAPFIAAIRATMRHAGALRIDHVMGLGQLYMVPAGMDARDGAYIRYPLRDLLRIVALESVRHRCLVIGEDLGTVPPGFRETLAEARILSYRVLTFERGKEGGLLPPEDYPAQAVALIGTHDLPTLKGLWLERDVYWRTTLDLYPDAACRGAEIEGRASDRRHLIDAFIAAGVLGHEDADRLLPADAPPVFLTALVEAAHLYLARSPSSLLLAQLEDILEDIESPNLPGTIDAHPNWRRRLKLTVEDILRDPRFVTLAEKLTRLRPQTRALGDTP